MGNNIATEITRLETAKTDIEAAIEECGVSVPDDDLISTYATYIRQIPSVVVSDFKSGLTLDTVGGTDRFIQVISQTDGLITATEGGIVSISSSGLVPKADGADVTISDLTNDWVLAKTGTGTDIKVDWCKLPAFALQSQVDGMQDLINDFNADIANLYNNKSEVGHIHNTSEITALTSYTKATEPSDISTTDTLNSALGKVEYKADRAFSWITGGSSNCLTIGNLEDGSTDNIKTGNEIFVYQNVDNLLAIDKTSLPTASTSQAGIIQIGTTANTAMAGNKTLTNVSYTNTTTNSNYPLLFKYYTGSTTTDAGTRFNAGIYANPSTVTISATNGFYETSDERLKDFQGNIDVDLDKLALIPKKYFTWKDDSEKVLRIGTSAQELQKLYPELVSDINGELTVDYAKLSIVALDAVDKLNTKVKSLEERLSKLESILSNLINS